MATCFAARGGSGIRTHETRKGPTGFQDQRLRPLGHPSVGTRRAESRLGGAGDGPNPDSQNSMPSVRVSKFGIWAMNNSSIVRALPAKVPVPPSQSAHQSRIC